MKCIGELVDHIYEELNDAENYAELAISCSAEDRQLAETYISISKEEINHMNRLHDQIIRLIQDKKNQGIEIPHGMQEIYDYEHKKIIKRAAEVQLVISSYK